jgi:hypothetical protein
MPSNKPISRRRFGAPPTLQSSKRASDAIREAMTKMKKRFADLNKMGGRRRTHRRRHKRKTKRKPSVNGVASVKPGVDKDIVESIISLPVSDYPTHF